MKTKSLLFLNITFVSAVLILNIFYQANDFSFPLKCICSILFATLGIINLIFAKKFKAVNMKFYGFQATALILAMLGDILIGINFILGAATFALGHVIFVLAYSTLSKFSSTDILPGAILFLFAGAFILFFPLFDFGGITMKAVCLVYALIISLMLGKTLGNFVLKRNSVNTAILLGSMLFFFSDLMLSLERFTSLGRWTSHACMGTYYPALCLLAFSMFLKIRKDLKNRN